MKEEPIPDHMTHKPFCNTNISCAVYHADGICPNKNTCNCQPLIRRENERNEEERWIKNAEEFLAPLNAPKPEDSTKAVEHDERYCKPGCTGKYQDGFAYRTVWYDCPCSCHKKPEAKYGLQEYEVVKPPVFHYDNAPPSKQDTVQFYKVTFTGKGTPEELIRLVVNLPCKPHQIIVSLTD